MTSRVTITDESVIAEARAAGVKLALLDGCPGSEHHRCWSVLYVGAVALLHWSPENGFRYRARFGRRWSIRRRGHRLSTVLDSMKRDTGTEREYQRRLDAKYGRVDA